MRKEETNRYVGTPGGLEEEVSAGATLRHSSDSAIGGTLRIATSTEMELKSTVCFVEMRPSDSAVSLGQHDALIAMSHSPFIAAQHAC